MAWRSMNLCACTSVMPRASTSSILARSMRRVSLSSALILRMRPYRDTASRIDCTNSWRDSGFSTIIAPISRSRRQCSGFLPCSVSRSTAAPVASTSFSASLAARSKLGPAFTSCSVASLSTPQKAMRSFSSTSSKPSSRRISLNTAIARGFSEYTMALLMQRHSFFLALDFPSDFCRCAAGEWV